MQGARLVENKCDIDEQYEIAHRDYPNYGLWGIAGNQIFVPGNAAICAELFRVCRCMSVDIGTKW